MKWWDTGRSPLSETPSSFSAEERALLVDTAWDAIEYFLHRGESLTIHPDRFPAALQEPRASFVTLKINDALRGCIGSLAVEGPLVENAAVNARKAAFEDPRFQPLTWDEFEQLDLSISVLQPPEYMAVESEEQLLAELRPGIDGLILEEGVKRATFLPSVWESLETPHAFLRELKRKGGWRPDAWSSAIDVYRYSTETIGEPD